MYLLAKNSCPGIKRELEIQEGMSSPVAIVGQFKGTYSGGPKQAQGYINGGELTAWGVGATMGFVIERFAFSRPSLENRGNSTMSLSSRRFKIFLMENESLLEDRVQTRDWELFATSMSERFTGLALERQVLGRSIRDTLHPVTRSPL